jgi:hypothetical protein
MLKNLRSPFDMLRSNGGSLEIVANFPFMLSLSKHVNSFFSSLLDIERVQWLSDSIQWSALGVNDGESSTVRG